MKPVRSRPSRYTKPATSVCSVATGASSAADRAATSIMTSSPVPCVQIQTSCCVRAKPLERGQLEVGDARRARVEPGPQRRAGNPTTMFAPPAVTDG